MWIIGLLLLAAAVVVGVDIATRNDTQVDLEAFNHVWTSSPAAAFIVGVVTALVGAFGLWLMVNSFARARVRRTERRAEMAERDRLADERRRDLEREPVAAGAVAGRRDDYDTVDRDRDVRDRDVRDRDLNDRDVRDRDLNDRDMRDRDLNDRDMRDRDLSDRDMRDREMSDRDTRDRDMSNRDDVRDRDMADRDTENRDDRDIDLRDRPAADEEEEAPHRHGLFHRSDR